MQRVSVESPNLGNMLEPNPRISEDAANLLATSTKKIRAALDASCSTSIYLTFFTCILRKLQVMQQLVDNCLQICDYEKPCSFWGGILYDLSSLTLQNAHSIVAKFHLSCVRTFRGWPLIQSNDKKNTQCIQHAQDCASTESIL